MKELIIFYDIVNDKTRTKLVAILDSYGIRIQKSVYSCNISKKRYEILMKKVKRYNQNKDDTIIIIELKEYTKIVIGKETKENVLEDIVL